MKKFMKKVFRKNKSTTSFSESIDSDKTLNFDSDQECRLKRRNSQIIRAIIADNASIYTDILSDDSSIFDGCSQDYRVEYLQEDFTRHLHILNSK
jgi:hypothetical protein